VMPAALPNFSTHPGNGPPMLLVHGFLSSAAQWQLNLDALASVCTPVVMELYGHGRSSSPDDGDAYTPSAYVDAMEQIRKSLGVEAWYLCGYSLGGALTIRYALTHPERLLGHVFTNSNSAFARQETVRAWTENAERAAASIRKGGLAAIEAIGVHPKNGTRLPTRIYEALLADAKLLNPQGIAHTLANTMPTASVREDIHQNAVPALLAYGRFEKGFVDHRRFAETRMPKLRVRAVDSGHAVNMESAEKFNAAVIEFVRDTDR
ncbi:MAG: alpha/beta fold hydrolase, partial [Gammaproteobacteria bacterium]|nr:alpha/beta fold hydrolase [Gammaproteobacteria bacterium]